MTFKGVPRSVSDPLHFYADPDPRIRFRDNGSGSGSGSGSEQIPFIFFLLKSRFLLIDSINLTSQGQGKCWRDCNSSHGIAPLKLKKYIWKKNTCVQLYYIYVDYGGRATGRHSSDRPFNRPTDPPTESDRKRPRHPTKKMLQRSLASVKSFQWYHRTESKIRSDDTIYYCLQIFFLTFYLNLSALSPLTDVLGPLSCSSRSTRPPSLL